MINSNYYQLSNLVSITLCKEDLIIDSFNILIDQSCYYD